ncbi:MAG: exodeoxyribonuclease V subunit beta [Deltaproteobacteria bacterium]|nr:exodeoxyribonuclease V subunit beta [Deltaproteobacteria bacterium]
MQRFDLHRPDFEPRLHLIEANAGTGKTHSIVGMLLHLILSGKHTIDSILVVTFTNAATDELKTRIRNALLGAKDYFSSRGGEKAGHRAAEYLDYRLFNALDRKRARRLLKQALADFDQARIYTIHSFCNQILQQHAFECGVPFGRQIVESDSELVEIAAADFFRNSIVHHNLSAAIASRRNWSPSSLIAIYRAAKRYPRMRFLPLIEESRGQLENEIAVALKSAARFAEDSPLLQHWRDDLFKKGKRPACPDNDPIALVRGLAADLEGVDILFPLDLTSDRLGGANASETILNRRTKFAKSYDPKTDPVVQACDLFAELIKRYEIKLLYLFLSESETRLERIKLDQGLIAFNDLLEKTHRALAAQPRGAALAEAIRRRLSAALIDEFQDTDYLQYEIFKRVLEGRPWYIIGDPKQAIYGFRGADVYTYLKAKKEAQGIEYTLNINWRSSAELVEAINLLFQSEPAGDQTNRSSFLIDGIRFFPSQVPAGRTAIDGRPKRGERTKALTWWRFKIEQDSDLSPVAVVIEAIKSEIVHLLQTEAMISDTPLNASDIAILVNSNHQAELVQQALLAINLPAVVSQTGDIYQTEEMGQLIHLLRALIRPNRSDRVRIAVTTRIWGMDANTLAQHDDDEARWQRLIDELMDYRQRWLKSGFMNMFETLMHSHRARERFLAFPQGERKLANLLQAAEIAQRDQFTLQLSQERLIDHLRRERNHGSSNDREARELRLETDDHAVRVITVHKSKGLQFPIVFCPFAWELGSHSGEPPVLVHDGDEILCDFGSELLASNRVREENERLAEDMRKLYVALTRAKHRCYVAWGIPADPRAERKVAGSALTRLLLMHAEKSEEREQAELPLVFNTIEKLVGRNPDLMCFEDIGSRCRSVWSAKSLGDSVIAEPRKNLLTPERLRTWQITSFSLLTKRTSSELPDHDVLPEAGSFGREQRRGRGIHAFSAGAKTGTCLHEIFENADFTKVDEPETRALVERKLVQYALDKAERHPEMLLSDPVDTVFSMVRSVIHTRLRFDEAAVLFLDRVSLDDRLSEWEFHLRLTSVVPADLQRVFASQAKGWIGESYAQRLARLDAHAVSGYLKGYVDLICRQNERFYLIDWKSNRLADEGSGYTPEEIQSAMAQHHYVLQYHLYVLALHRFLERHQPGYQYEKQFGGVAYAFLRGIENRETSSRGWYLDRPPLELIEALNQLLSREEQA